MHLARALGLIAVNFVIAACICLSTGIGDSGTGVLIRNGTSGQITVTEVAQAPDGSDLVSRLAVGGERQSLWHFRTGSQVTLSATSATGTPIFCHRYAYEELRRADSDITITAGVLDCH